MSKYSVRNIILGVGIGLVISSIININASQQRLTVEQLEKEAERYNLKLVKNEIEKSYPEEVTTPTPQPEQQDIDESQNDENQQKNTVEFYIKKGSNSYNIADGLIEKGLIKDKQAFIDRLYELDKSGKAQAGTFYIPENADIDTIIKIITTIRR